MLTKKKKKTPTLVSRRKYWNSLSALPNDPVPTVYTQDEWHDTDNTAETTSWPTPICPARRSPAQVDICIFPSLPGLRSFALSHETRQHARLATPWLSASHACSPCSLARSFHRIAGLSTRILTMLMYFVTCAV